jgi:hypothetical protein
LNKTYLLALMVCLLASSCKNDSADDRQPLARVGDAYLYFEDIEAILPQGLASEDSTAHVQSLIYNWGKEQLLLSKAKFNLPEKQQDIEKLVEDYRNDLLKFAFKKAYVNQNLDTVISEAAVEAYYKENSHNFELRENILQCSYFVIPDKAPILNDIKKKFRSNKPADWDEVRQYAASFSSVASFDDTTWIGFDELNRIFPLEVINQVDFLRRNTHVIAENDGVLLFLRIEDYKIRESVSPLQYVSQTIRNILLNQRKMELIQKMEKKLVEDAYDKKNFEIFR